MKARKVHDLDPDGTFVENAEKILAVRKDELEQLARRAQDPRKVKALHDTRIAAKRLRYLYEITEPCFGEQARRGVKFTRGLQDVLGEIHDCDVMSERIRARALDFRVEDERYLGLDALATYLEAKRRVLHRHFVDVWGETEL